MSEQLFDELTDEFVAEIRDLLDAIEPDFLAMEESRDDVDPELINRAFRAIHSIKGSAGFAGFNALKTLSHGVENVLVKLRDREMTLDPDKMDAMLAGMDKLRLMVDDIHASNKVPYADEIDRLNHIILKSEAKTPARPEEKDASEDRPDKGSLPPKIRSQAEEKGHGETDTQVNSAIKLKAGEENDEYIFEVPREQLAALISDAMYLFALRVYPDKDLREKDRNPETFKAALEETGRCLAASTSPDGISYFLFGTILEPEFITNLFDIPNEQIYKFERESLLVALEDKRETAPSDAASYQDDNKITLKAPVGMDSEELIFETETDKLAAVISDAMYLFALRIHTDKDLKEKNRNMESLRAEFEESGRILSADTDANGICYVLFGTILEPEFVTNLFDIPNEQIYTFERAALIEVLEQKGETPPSLVQKKADTEQADEAVSSDETERNLSESEFDPTALAKAIEGGKRSEVRGEESEIRDQESGVRDQEVEVREQESEDEREQQSKKERATDDIAQPATDKKQQTTDNKQQITDNKQQTTDNKQQTTNNRQQTTPPRPPSETIRVTVDLVDKLMNLVGEMVLGRNQLHRAIQNFIDENPHINPLMQNLNVVISEVQENIMQMRMQPVANLLNKFPRMVRDLSRQMSKKVDLIIDAGEVELDKSILEGLSTPLTHLVRNCVDHGIESPEVRKEFGKPAAGKIHLKVFHDGGQVNIVINDDGKGIDAEKVAEKALSKNILEPDQIRRMSENEKLSLIFLPGLSTAETVTDISGRGVGMDVVKTNISKLGGHINLESEAGKGTTVHIIIPLTLAIIPSLIVGAGKFRFAIPQMNVQELVCVRGDDPGQRIEKVGGFDVLRIRGRLLPLVSLADILEIPCTFIHPVTGEELPERRKSLTDRQRNRPIRNNQKESNTFFSDVKLNSVSETEEERRAERRQNPCNDLCIAILKAGMNAFGLHVDQIFDNEEIVVKPLSNHLKDCKCFAGATIMGDGKVAMILDAAGIANYTELRFGEIEAEERRRKEKASVGLDTLRARQSILIFNNALTEYFALPLAGISRLELIETKMIERVGEQEFLTYHDEALPLLRLEKFLPVSPLPENPKELYVIIPKTSYSTVGIVVSRILDAMDADVSFLSLKRDVTTAQGFWGSVMFNGHLTFFLNTEELIELFEKKFAESIGNTEELP